jgi:hypothetical protein
VPRYVLERDLGVVSQEEMGEIAARSKHTAIEEFPDITWEHTHVADDARARQRASASSRRLEATARKPLLA